MRDTALLRSGPCEGLGNGRTKIRVGGLSSSVYDLVSVLAQGSGKVLK